MDRLKEAELLLKAAYKCDILEHTNIYNERYKCCLICELEPDEQEDCPLWYRVRKFLEAKND